MPTGKLTLDILLGKIIEDAITGRRNSIAEIRKQFSSLSDQEIENLYQMFLSAYTDTNTERAALVATAPPSFGIKAKSTMNTVVDLLEQASASILITGYSLSDYFSPMVDRIIQKSQSGVLVKFFVNQIENQNYFDKLCRYSGRFLKIYNYPTSEDKMSALHAKVICVDQEKTLITSANLSYHGQEGNIELGTLIESRKIAKEVEDLFTNLLFNKVFVEVKKDF